MTNTAALRRVENIQELNLEGIFKISTACLAIFLAAFIAGIFVCKGIIYSQVVQGIEVEGLLGANFATTAVISSLIMWLGKNGQWKKAAALGAFGAMLSGAVAYAVACVVFG